MTPVPGTNLGPAQSLTPAGKARETQRVQAPQEGLQNHREPLPKPQRDQYLPEEKPEPIGRYWMGKDEQGQPKIFFDHPQKAGPASPTNAPEKAEPERKAEICICDTGKVDRELEKLKKRQSELKQSFATEANPARRQDLEKKLNQVERELEQKDNDTYRRQHASYT